MIIVSQIGFVLINLILQTGAEKTFQPYGPKMCDLLCQKTKGCLDSKFDEVQLRCHVNVHTSNQNSSRKEMEDVADTHSMLKRQENATSKQPDVKYSRGNVTGTPCPPAVVEYLMEACEDGDLDEVKRLLSLDSVDVNCQDSQGRTALMTSIGFSQVNIFDILMQQKPDLSAIDDQNENVLHLACLSGSIKFVKALLDTARHGYKFDIDCGERSGTTPIMLAVGSGSKRVVEFLYKQHNASLTTSNNIGRTILHMACVNGRLDVLKYLLTLPELKGFESKKDTDGRTPQQSAKKYHHEEIVKFLKHWKNKSGYSRK